VAKIVLVWIPGLAGLRGMAWQSRDPVGLCRPEGCSPAKIVNVCGLPAWQALGSRSGRDHAGLRVGSLGELSLGGAEVQTQGLEIPWPAEQWLYGPLRQGLACSTGYSFSISWCGAAFH
jgi:hypothetical protein